MAHPRCTICSHVQRPEIEAAMGRGIGKRQAAKLFNISPDAVQRHWQKHCPESVKVAARVKWAAPKAALSRLTLAEQNGVLEYLRTLRGDLLQMFDAAKADAHYASIAAISRELRGVLELTAKLTGELREATKAPSTAEISTSREYLDLRSRLLSALRRFPEAHAAVMAEFARTEALAAAEMTAPAMIEAQVAEMTDK